MDGLPEVADKDLRDPHATYGITVIDEYFVFPDGPPRPRKRARSCRVNNWIMLDNFLCPLGREDFTGLALTKGTTSKGETIFVGFSAAAPPKTSRLFYNLYLNLERPGSSSGDDSGSWISDAKAVAAHGDCILLRILIIDAYPDAFDPDTGEPICDREIREELFLFRASFPCTLINLPKCVHGLINHGVRNNIGILRCNDGSFLVAHLRVTRNRCSDQTDCPVTADICYIQSKNGQWQATESIPICNAEGQDHLKWWVADTVITFGQYICWVDYLRGVLFYDALSPCPQLWYVPLPVDPYRGDIDTHFGCRGPLSAYRSVCVTDGGKTMKFVDVSSSKLWFYGSERRRPYCAMTTWTLNMTNDSRVWIEDGWLEEEALVAITNKYHLPCTQVEFPLVDRTDSNFIYFVLKEKSCLHGTAHLLKIDMSSMKPCSITRYTFGSFTLLGSDAYKFFFSCNLFNHEPFLPCELSEPLDQGHEDVGGLVPDLIDPRAIDHV